MPDLQHAPRAVLVTGGAGFIGANFLHHMVPAHPDVRFVNLDALTYAGNLLSLQPLEGRENYQFVHGDIADGNMVEQLFEEHAFSTVVHFAAESHVDRSIMDPLAFVRTNVVGTATLLEAARQRWRRDGGFDGGRVRFYHVSTDEVFGSLGDEGAFSETTPYDPRSPYSASKAGSDHLVRAYGHTYGLPVVLSNCSNNYGPYQFPEKLIPVVIQNAIHERPVPVYGQGQQVRDWLYVADHVRAIEAILLHGTPGETYCVGGAAERRNIDLVRALLDAVDEALGRPPGTSQALIRFVEDRPGHDYRYAMDFSKLARTLGWAPEHALDGGLRATVRWYLSHGEWLEAVTSGAYRDYYEAQYGDRLERGVGE